MHETFLHWVLEHPVCVNFGWKINNNLKFKSLDSFNLNKFLIFCNIIYTWILKFVSYQFLSNNVLIKKISWFFMIFSLIEGLQFTDPMHLHMWKTRKSYNYFNIDICKFIQQICISQPDVLSTVHVPNHVLSPCTKYYPRALTFSAFAQVYRFSITRWFKLCRGHYVPFYKENYYLLSTIDKINLDKHSIDDLFFYS